MVELLYKVHSPTRLARAELRRYIYKDAVRSSGVMGFGKYAVHGVVIGDDTRGVDQIGLWVWCSLGMEHGRSPSFKVFFLWRC